MSFVRMLILWGEKKKKYSLASLRRTFVSEKKKKKKRGFLRSEPSGKLINVLQKKGRHLAFTAGLHAIPTAQQTVCKVPHEPLTVICVQVEQILELIKPQPRDGNVKKTNFAFGSGRMENRWLTSS